MRNEASNCELLTAWQNGSEDAAAVLFRRYQVRLISLVRSRLSRRLARRVDAEDIVLSAYRSFFLAARSGRLTPTVGDELWPILVTVTMRKLAHQARAHQSARREMDRELANGSAWMQSILSSEPAPDHAALLADEIEQQLKRLDSVGRDVLTQTLQGVETSAIATAIKMSSRSVRRIQERIRRELSQDSVPPIARGVDFRSNINVKSFETASPASSIPRTSYDQLLLHQLTDCGAFSKVYRATDRSSGQTVAVKFLRKNCWADPRATEALMREAELLQKLSHPRILRMHGWGKTPHGALFLVSDYVAGGNLEQRRDLTLAQIVAITTQVADAVAAAHAAGVLHCDLKPANVLMGAAGEVVLADFGLARWAQAPDDVPPGGTAGFWAASGVAARQAITAGMESIRDIAGTPMEW